MLRRLGRRPKGDCLERVASDLAVVLFRAAPVGVGGDEAGNIYPVKGAPCTRCVTGVKHEGALRTLGLRDEHRALIVTESDDVLVHADAVDALLSRVSGDALELGRVIDAETGELLPYRRLSPMITLPQTAVGTTAIQTDPLGPPCNICRRDGHFGRRGGDRLYCFKAAEMPAGSLFTTWECFGNSRTHDQSAGNHAAPHIVMRKSLVSWLRDARVPHAVVPVYINPTGGLGQ